MGFSHHLEVFVRAKLDYKEEFLKGVVLHPTVKRHLDRVDVERGREDVVANKAIVEPFAAVVFAHKGFEDMGSIALKLLSLFLAFANGAAVGCVKSHGAARKMASASGDMAIPMAMPMITAIRSFCISTLRR
jgi:hypothetical protein